MKMLGAEHLLPDHHRALVEWSCPRTVALVLQRSGEVVEARRRGGMLQTEHLFTDRQRALTKSPSLCISGEGASSVAAEAVQQIGGLRLRSLRNHRVVSDQSERNR